MQCVKLEFYVPTTHVNQVKEAVFSAGAGKIDNYDYCSWETEGSGQFRPCSKSHPFIGEIGKIETISETKVELICGKQIIPKVIEALKLAHPYETPAYQYWDIQS